MGRAAPHISQLAATNGRPIIAHVTGGPFHGTEQVLYRPATVKSWRVRRGTFRRALGGGPRYAWYQLERVWTEDDVDHGEYAFRGLKSVAAPKE